ncbi:polysaccharide deacetylase [Diaporthe helianthi]|uniref:Polysaccharide deacetylase n=1 Tax=Diaporthe helianthi TaxID=158607 RepID=A0A2P5HNG2_DIAHE|nr:polysaccharide deacetylase [Diaporthe helianthi]
MNPFNSTSPAPLPAVAGAIMASPPAYHPPAVSDNSTLTPLPTDGEACGYGASDKNGSICGYGLCCSLNSNTCGSDAKSCGATYCLPRFSTGCQLQGTINEELKPQARLPSSDKSSSRASFQERQTRSAEYADAKSSTLSNLYRRPSLPWLADLPRPELGNVPYGELITTCNEPWTVALTFDDGPWYYTEDLLDILRDYEAVATFFVCGGNMGGDGQITDHGHPQLLQRMVNEGHQVGTHTWAHSDLSTVGEDAIVDQLLLNEQALVQALGRIPTYFRPPYFSTNDDVLDTVGSLGYHVINADVDTNDWKGDYDAARQAFSQAVHGGQGDGAGGKIVLAHDIHDRTVHELAAFMIEQARNAGFRLVTVGECMGDPEQNWYRDPRTGGPYGSARSKPGSRRDVNTHLDRQRGSFYPPSPTEHLENGPLETGQWSLPLHIPTPTHAYNTPTTAAAEPVDPGVARRGLEAHDEPPQPRAILLAFGPGAGPVNEGGSPSSKATFALVLALATVFFFLQ